MQKSAKKEEKKCHTGQNAAIRNAKEAQKFTKRVKKRQKVRILLYWCYFPPTSSNKLSPEKHCNSWFQITYQTNINLISEFLDKNVCKSTFGPIIE